MQSTTSLKTWAALAASALLAACGGGSGETGPVLVTERSAPNHAVVALKAGAAGIAALDETLIAIGDEGPQRSLVFTPADGGATWRLAAPAGWALVDVAVHPSGELSAVLAPADAAAGQASVGALRLWRIGRDGLRRHEQAFTDPAVADDPFHDQGGSTMPNSLQPRLTRDAVRLAPLGEDLALALKSGQHAVIAYRLDWRAASANRPAGFERAWRTLVEPGSSLGWRFLGSGSHDVFGQLDNHAQLRLDSAADGTLGVGVVSAPWNDVFGAHGWHFGTPIAAPHGVLFTRLAADGRRLSVTTLDTRQVAELHGLRALPGGGWGLVGRVRSEQRPDGSGWDAWVALLDAQGQGAVRKLDIDRGDVLFDIAALPGGGHAAVGSTGWTQNPTGASISEDAAPLLLTLGADGALRRRIDLPPVATGPRQNQLRAIAAHGGQWWLGGLLDGPGTHSGDVDRSRVRADGYVLRASGLS